MAAVIMHHFSGLAAPFVRSKGTVSGGVFTHNLTSKFSALTSTLLEAKRYDYISLMQNQPYQYQAGFRYSIRIQYEGYRGHFRPKARQPALCPGHSKRTVKLTFHGPFDGLI